MAILDFWTTNLNPITMLSREPDSLYNAKKYNQKSSYTSKKIDLENDPAFIPAKYVIETLGIPAKTIGIQLRKLGIEKVSYKQVDKVFYRVEDIERVEVVKKSKINPTDEYISAVELRDILNLTTMQLFTLSNRNKWKKFRFIGRQNYFLRSQVLK